MMPMVGCWRRALDATKLRLVARRDVKRNAEEIIMSTRTLCEIQPIIYSRKQRNNPGTLTLVPHPASHWSNESHLKCSSAQMDSMKAVAATRAPKQRIDVGLE